MRLIVAAIGRLPRGPEDMLCQTLARRIDALGRSTRIGPLEIRALEPKPAERGRAGEAALLRRALEGCERSIALDERGAAMSSVDFAETLGRWRDDGVARLGLMIGGADGLEPELRAEADLTLSFGAMTWPHALARAMACEQLYRASTILAGHPYHREG